MIGKPGMALISGALQGVQADKTSDRIMQNNNSVLFSELGIRVCLNNLDLTLEIV
jgi:hypothetical protein